MMKLKMRWLSILIGCILFGTTGLIHAKTLPVVTLHEKDIFNFESELDENEIFLRSVFGFEYDGRHIYYLDNHLCSIYKVELDSFKLVKMISSRGQGPGELSIPLGLSCKNGKLYVVDIGYGGIKIFDTEGKLLKQFKVKGASFGAGMNSKYIVDVSDEEEIYIRCKAIEEGNLISVYDINGRYLRGLIPNKREPGEKYLSSRLKNKLIFTLDNFGHIIVLFVKSGELQKFDKQGKLLWSRNILKELPEKERNEEPSKRLKDGTIMTRINFLGISLLEDNRIFASGVFSGLLLSADGKIIGRFKSPAGKGGFGDLLFWKGNHLIGMEKQFDFQRYIKLKPMKDLKNRN
jgi:hypothetical protein